MQHEDGAFNQSEDKSLKAEKKEQNMTLPISVTIERSSKKSYF